MDNDQVQEWFIAYSCILKSYFEKAIFLLTASLNYVSAGDFSKYWKKINSNTILKWQIEWGNMRF